MEIKITEKKLNIKVEYVCIYLYINVREDNDQCEAKTNNGPIG